MPALLTQSRSKLGLLCVAPPAALVIVAGALMHSFGRMGISPPPHCKYAHVEWIHASARDQP